MTTEGIRLEGVEQLQKIADALKEAGDKDLQKQVSAALRGEAKPLGARVLARGAEEMPHRGGLAARVADIGRVGVSSALRGRVASVQVILRNKGVDLKSMDAGIVRHPVFLRNRTDLLRRKTVRGKGGHILGGEDRKDWTWVRQSVPAGAFRRAFEAESAEVQQAALKAAQAVLDDVARKA